MHLENKDLTTESPFPDEVTAAGGSSTKFRQGDPKSRGMNNEEKKLDKARREGNVYGAEQSAATSKSDMRSGPSTSSKVKKEPSISSKTPSAAPDKSSGSPPKTKDNNGSSKNFKPGDPSSRGMNNEEKKADKARREGKSGPETDPTKQKENASSDFKSGDPSSRGMNNEEKKQEKAKRTSGMNTSGEKSDNIAVKSGGTKPRGMNNEEKKADKARREGRAPDEGAGRGSGDAEDVRPTTETATPAPKTSKTATPADRLKSTTSTAKSMGPGGAGEGEGLTPTVTTGGYEREYSGTAIVPDDENIPDGSASPINHVDKYGDTEPTLGKESTVESEASVDIEGQSAEEEPFGEEDKAKKSRSGAEEMKRAAMKENPSRQSDRIKSTGKRKMREPRESEDYLISEDEERVKKASKKI